MGFPWTAPPHDPPGRLPWPVPAAARYRWQPRRSSASASLFLLVLAWARVRLACAAQYFKRLSTHRGSRKFPPSRCPSDAHRMKVNDLLSLTVTDVALGGMALARHEGRVVFLDRGLPGDLVEARVTRVRRNFAEAGLDVLVGGSSERVSPPCPHVQRCGGCRFQDLDYGAQCRLKERQVRETLIHLGGVADPPVRSITPAPDIYH